MAKRESKTAFLAFLVQRRFALGPVHYVCDESAGRRPWAVRFSFSPSGRERALAQQTFAAVFRQHELLLQVELMRVSIRVATGVFSFVFREDVPLVSAPTSQRKLGPSRAVWVAVLNIALILAEYLSASSSVMADDGKE